MLIFSIYLIWANLYTICYRYSLHLLAWFQTQSNSQNTVGGCRNIFLALKWSKINFSGIFFLGQFVINWYVRSLSFLPLVSLLPKNVFQNLAFHLEFRHVHMWICERGIYLVIVNWHVCITFSDSRWHFMDFLKFQFIMLKQRPNIISVVYFLSTMIIVYICLYLYYYNYK